ncbi:TetR family transcriptional regulator [Pseudomonas sp. ChxA]|uniref:TetR family transcriptional regulator n=1 Tax=Pseudomonas synxantha TaxID=47883 RepID=A0ABS0UHY3_9PSED|nr:MULTISPECIES: TetR family transcriptional regulator [Pseudomonas]MBI6565186.1 TetR family transcriptional regulator [Pseudomonas synxantha]MBI6579900.1 TetR family transcriptional regulator [Pseudomonas synxantha]MBI6646688.1 TetR family transcriptional regulator [Pseudomonas synxantha]MBJ2287380.1 TetR family transcriptional regulator [Pseudomonas sp. MF6755]MDL2184677.1 TetR family transcriptional regulator [Pseudomonas sp. ChxA]
MANKSTQDHTPGRSRFKTLDALDKVIDSLVAGNEKLSIASVARAAGVTPGLIHNTYPAVAEKIRNLMGKSVRAQRDSKHQALMSEKEKNKLLRAENDRLLEEVARIASVNQRLLFEMAELKAVSSGKVVAMTPKPGK